MNALVTGANGLIGANLVRVLQKQGHTVRVFVRPTSDCRALADLNNLDYAYGDVRDADSLTDAARGCEVLFHTAAVFAYHGVSPDDLQSVAVNGALNAVQAAAQAGVGRMVLTSSSVVCGSSTNTLPRHEASPFDAKSEPPYCVAKAQAETAAFAFARETGVALIAVCPTITVGAYDTRLGPSNAVLLNYLKDPLRTTFPGGCNIVAVADVARGHVLAAERGKAGERYLLGGENLEWSLVQRMVAEMCGLPPPRLYANRSTSYVLGAMNEVAGRLWNREPSVGREQAKMVGRFYWYRHERAARELGYAPMSGRRALAHAVAWLVTSPHIDRELRARLRLSPEVWEARADAEEESFAVSSL